MMIGAQSPRGASATIAASVRSILRMLDWPLPGGWLPLGGERIDDRVDRRSELGFEPVEPAVHTIETPIDLFLESGEHRRWNIRLGNVKFQIGKSRVELLL